MLIKTHRVPLRGNPVEKVARLVARGVNIMNVFAFYGRFIVLCVMFHAHLPLLMSLIVRIIFVLRQFQQFFFYFIFNISLYADLKVSQHDIYEYMC